jgi:hypothetical protein
MIATLHSSKSHGSAPTNAVICHIGSWVEVLLVWRGLARSTYSRGGCLTLYRGTREELVTIVALG